MGAAVSLGQTRCGVGEGPRALRAAGLLERLGAVDHGDVVDARHGEHANSAALVAGVRYPREVGRACERVTHAQRGVAVQPSAWVTVGGDHSVAMGSVSTSLALHGNVGLLWVDAHADCNVPQTSPSGNLHGMPLAALLGLMRRENLPGFAWLDRFVCPEHVVLIGLRDVDPGEQAIVDALGIRVFTAQDVARIGGRMVAEMALEYLARLGVTPLHMSFDMDALDPSVAPGTGTAVPNGLRAADAFALSQVVAASRQLVALDIVEVDPSMETAEQAGTTVALACDIAAACFEHATEFRTAS